MTMPETTLSELANTLAVQKVARLKEGAVSAAVRHKRIQRVIDMAIKYRDPICEAAHADFGNRSRTVTLMFDIFGSVASLKAARWA